MRTTVTLDPDVELLLRRAVRERGLPFKQVLNGALRDGLRRDIAAAGARPAFRQRTFPMGAASIDLSRANALADELGDEALLAKMRAHR